jgi:hypothetical protein
MNMTKKVSGVLLGLILLALILVWNTTYYWTPRLINADGIELHACKGILSVTSEGSPPTYSIAYTDQVGDRVNFYGIHKLEVIDTRDIGRVCAESGPSR